MKGQVIDITGKNMSIKKSSKIIIAIVIVLAALVVLGNSFFAVQAGHTGVVTTFGKVSTGVLGEGLHIKVPFVQQIVQIDNRVLKTDVQSSSASKDLQTVSSTISVNYRIGQDKSAEIYRNVGIYFDEVIVKPAVQECVKAVTAKYTAEELISNRQVVSQEMKDALASKITPYGLNIEVFNIISFDFSEEFNKAIEAKQTAQQNALKAEQDLARIKVEAQQKIEQAKAEAEAYKLKSQEITDAMIRMEYIDKWDGKLPTVVSDGTNILDIGGMISGTTSSSATTPATPTPAQ